jgi:6-pyruvoyl-tetrahydropterin synthase related domain
MRSNSDPYMRKSFLNRCLPFFCSLIIVLSAISLFHPIFSPGYLIYRDQPVTLAMAHSAVKNLFPAGEFFGGWEPANSAGYPNLLYYSKAGFWLIGLIHLLPTVSVITAHKIALFISLIAAPVALFFCLRRICGEMFALFLSLVFLLQDNHIYYALNGQWNYSLGVAAAIGLIWSCLKYLEKPCWRTMGMAAVWLALVCYAHLYAAIGGAVWMTVVFALVLIKHKRRVYRMLQMAAGVTAAALILAPYMWAILKTTGWLSSGEAGEMSAAETFGSLISVFFFIGDFFRKGPVLPGFGGNLAFMAAAALFIFSIALVFMKRSRPVKFRIIALLGGTAICLALSSGFWLNWDWVAGCPFLAYTKIHGYRFMLFAKAGMLLAGGYSAGWLCDLVKKKEARSLLFIRHIIPGALALFLIANVPSFFQDDSSRRSKSLMATSQELEFIDDVESVWSWFKENASDEDARVYFHDTLGNFKLKKIKRLSGGSRTIKVEEWNADDKAHFSHLMAPAAFSTGLAQAGSWTGGNLWPVERYLLGESERFFGKKLEDIDLFDLVIKQKLLQQYNIKYVVSCGLFLKGKLEGSGLFNKEFESGSFAIFSLSDEFFTPEWARLWPRELGTISKAEVFRDRIEVDLETSAGGTKLLIKMAHHPFWKAYIDCGPAAISMTETGLMELADLPGGKHLVVLKFRPVNTLCIVLAAIGLIGAVTMAWRS